MELIKVTIVSSCLTLALITMFPSLITCARIPPQEYLDAHNPARIQVGDPPLVWNQTLAVYAKAYANKRRDCALIKSNGPYGENIATAPRAVTAKHVVDAWVRGGVNYDTQILSGCMDPDDAQCDRYTQVVWSKTKSIGCARTACTKKGMTFVICNYYPPKTAEGIAFVPKDDLPVPFVPLVAKD
jgi:pathogenesis-related protein 1